MENKRWVISLIAVWTGAIVLFLYIPIFSVIASSFGKSRYFRFPVKTWSTKWYDETLGANLTTDLHLTSFYVAGCVALIAVVLGFFGALAFARYDWRGRQFYQRLIMLPIFFPQAVLGLALLALVHLCRCAAELGGGGLRPSGLDRADRDAGDLDPGLRLRCGSGGGCLRSRREPLAGLPRGYAAGVGTRTLLRRALRLPAVLGQLPALHLHHRRGQHGDRVALHQDGLRLHADDPDHGRALGIRRHHRPLRRLHGPDRPPAQAAGTRGE